MPLSPQPVERSENAGDPTVVLFGKVRDEVLVTTGRAQQPYVYGTLGGEQIFLRPQRRP